MDKCALSVCSCAVLPGEAYCSEYCRQGAAQGVQKNFCQCGHAHCETRAAETNPLHQLGLPDSIKIRPGQLTIEYRSMGHLVAQLLLLARALDKGYAGLSSPAEKPPRRPADSETQQALRKRKQEA